MIGFLVRRLLWGLRRASRGYGAGRWRRGVSSPFGVWGRRRRLRGGVGRTLGLVVVVWVVREVYRLLRPGAGRPV